ncbi:MAG: hypothetical protein IJ870_00965 [Alphaproteobacteria bacterium]|nr:hypothetical protein [Alphaproteobacteria bacterium]
MMKFLKIAAVVLLLSFVMAPNGAMAQLSGAGGIAGHELISNDQGSFVAPNQPNAGNPTSTLEDEQSAMSESSKGYGGDANAKDIFSILQKKLYSTLVDLRKIVYVIAGFGLVMFAVAAIFNKISYKHLGYIMIGLSLLSLMFPFLEYFSGYSLESAQQKQLTFDNFLAASDYESIRGTYESDIKNPSGIGQEGLTEEEAARRREEMNSLLNDPENGILGVSGIDMPNAVTGGLGGLAGGLAGQEQRDAIINAGCSPVTMKGAWNPETMNRAVCSVTNGVVTTSYETCQGKLKNGTCTKTAGQIFNDIWKTGQDVIQFGLNAGQAFSGGASAIINTVKGVEQMGDILNSGMSFPDTILALSNSSSNFFGNTGYVTMGLQQILGGAMGMANTAGGVGTTWSTNYENNVNGANGFTALMGLLSGYANTAGNNLNQGAGYVNMVGSYGRDFHTQANNIDAMLDRFGGEGSQLSERWDSVFHPEEVNTNSSEISERAAEEAARRAAEEAARRAAEQAAAQAAALNNLTSEQIDTALESGQLTQEQAEALKKAQEEAAKKEAEQKAQECAQKVKAAQAAVEAAKAKVAAAQAALSEATDPGAIAAAMAALQAAQQAEAQAKENAEKAANACK